jgi:hypothetical protein
MSKNSISGEDSTPGDPLSSFLCSLLFCRKLSPKAAVEAYLRHGRPLVLRIRLKNIKKNYRHRAIERKD